MTLKSDANQKLRKAVADIVTAHGEKDTFGYVGALWAADAIIELVKKEVGK